MLQNIVFDLGGLFIDVHMHRTLETLERYTGRKPEAEMAVLKAQGVLADYETGQISTADFLRRVQEALPDAPGEAALIQAWNAVLGDFPITRLEGVQPLREHYRIFLLSNTNELHVTGFEDILEAQYGFRSLEPYFEKVYYSQRMGLRKPDPAIYHRVLDENGLLASETLFIDDSPENLVGAREAGLHTAHHPSNADIVATLKGFGLFDH